MVSNILFPSFHFFFDQHLYIAYDVNFTLYLGQGITVGSVPVPYSLSGINLTLYTGFYLPPGTPLALNISLNFTGLSQSNASSLSERLFISQTYSLMDLTAIPGEDEITQELDQQVEVRYFVHLTVLFYYNSR